MNATTSDADGDSSADERNTATCTHMLICEPLSIRYRRILC